MGGNFKRRLALLVCLAIGLVVPVHAVAQSTEPASREQPNTEDPTKAVFFSIRNEYFNLDRGNWTNALIFRSDRVLLRTHRRLGGKAGLLTRFDVPIVTAGIAGSTHAGLGDLYAQGVYVPWLTGRFGLAMGSGLAAPTATSRTLGTGKWKVAPLVAPVWFFPKRRGLFLVRVQAHKSFAGDEDRADINYLEIVPALIWNRQRWWTLIDSNTTVDSIAGTHVSRRSGIEIGHVTRRIWGLSVKTEIPWGSGRKGDWKLVCFVTRYRRR